MFGMEVIVKNYLDPAAQHVHLAPLIDSALGLIPRILLPSRDSYAQYIAEYDTLFETREGATSHTAYPFVGEFIMMGGYIGLVIGVIAYAFFYKFFHSALLKVAATRSQFYAGIGLLAAEMGYYHYSRGYLPQQIKAYVFVILPYIVMCAKERAAVKKAQAAPSIHIDQTDNCLAGQR